MIVMVNGSFGAGKTTVAPELLPLLLDKSFKVHLDTTELPPALVAARIAALVRAGTA
jgi:adenylate kinase family enzyme